MSNKNKRLAEAIEGRSVPIAEATGISRPQLARYAAGSPIPSDRLSVLADHLGVSAAWLIGEPRLTPPLLSDIHTHIREITSRILHLLQQYDTPKAFLPSEIGRIIQLVTISQHMAFVSGHQPAPLSEDMLRRGLHYLSALRTNDWLDVYVEGCVQLAFQGPDAFSTLWPTKWARLVQQTCARFYASEQVSGLYRPGAALKEPHIAMLQRWAYFLMAHPSSALKGRIRVLDAGCGAGSHLAHLVGIGEAFQPTGIDTSPLALAACASREQQAGGVTPTFLHGDFLDIPFPEHSFEAYMSIGTLEGIPLIAGCYDVGVGRALIEANRVLTPGGHALFVLREGAPDMYFPLFRASHPAESFVAAAKAAGFAVVSRKLLPHTKDAGEVRLSPANQEVWILQKSTVPTRA